jgi:hypothetical protein
MAQAVRKAMGGAIHWRTKVMDDWADFKGMGWAFITHESHRWKIVIGLKNPKKHTNRTLQLRVKPQSDWVRMKK